MDGKPKEVALERLRGLCDPDSLGVQSTREINKRKQLLVAQDKAVKGITFGLKMPGNDYNLYVAGPDRTGQTFIAKTYIEKIAKEDPPPSDWCYVYNFHEQDRPTFLKLKRGMGIRLKKDLSEFIEEVKTEIQDVFESEDYSKEKDAISKIFDTKRNELISLLEKKVNKEGFILNISQVGMMIMPSKDGKPMDVETIGALPKEERKRLQKVSQELQKQMKETMRTIRNLDRGLKEKIKGLDNKIALYRVGLLIEELETKYRDLPEVVDYLNGMKGDIILNIDNFKQKHPIHQGPFFMPQIEPSFNRYEVNVLIDNSKFKGAPVIVETNPTYPNLFGRIEKQSQFGALFTDFTMIRPGALHRANGGYLVIKAMDLLRSLGSWNALKRAIKNKEIGIEDLAEEIGFISTKTLKPIPIPLNIKVVLIGDPHIYHLLYSFDSDFKKMFKVKAQLDDSIKKTKKQIKNYLFYIAKACEEEQLLDIDKKGLARIIEYASELVGSQRKMSLKLPEIKDLVLEANFWAKQRGRKSIESTDIERAIDEKRQRSNLMETKIQDMIEEQTLNIQTKGQVIGQVNGLTIYDLGDYTFARPIRITSTATPGKEGIVDIEREAKMSGNIHTKGILIMESYLKNKYALNKPLALSASVTFEQSYGMVDGDSASAAELFAILSCLSMKPIRQGIAVTGSVSQLGECQPVGGITRKIEGFFDVCKARGLTGDQGVIIPKRNINDLMLRQEVVTAVEKGKFHIYAIENMDEGIEILTGAKAGKRDKKGNYPKNTLNYLVTERLRIMSESIKESEQKTKRRVKKGKRSANRHHQDKKYQSSSKLL
ncbi:MAG: Lon protease family protein [Desulfatiglandales bacterium]